LLEQVARPSDRLICSLCFSPDGNLLAWVPNYYPRCLHIWDVRNGRPYAFPPLTVGNIRSLAFYRDSKHLAFVGPDGVPEVWDVGARQKVYPSGPRDFRGAREGHPMGSLALSADDSWLAAQGARGAVTVWDMRQKELLLALPEEPSSNWGLAWSPNRAQLAAGFSDGSLVLWNIPRVRAQLAEIGLDWQDPPLPAEHPKPAAAPMEPPPIEPARLFALHLLGTARATLAAEGTICRVDVTAVDGPHWKAQLCQLFDDLEEGSTYTIRFRAKATARRHLKLSGSIEEPTRHDIGLDEEVSLTEDWLAYRYEFRAKNLTGEPKISFALGERTGTVWIADFTLTKHAK
jgi:hypothetical protein